VILAVPLGLAKVAMACVVIMDKLLWWWAGLASCLLLLCAGADGTKGTVRDSFSSAA